MDYKDMITGMDYSARAKRLQTKAARLQSEFIEQERAKMSKNEYWQTMVQTKDDIAKYFKIYHPEYPDCLCIALAEHLHKVAEAKANNETESRILQNYEAVLKKNEEKRAELQPFDFYKDIEDNGIKIIK